MSPTVLIHAPNVHGGGGGVLLRALLAEIPAEWSVKLICDERFEAGGAPKSGNLGIMRVPPRLRARLGSELLLRRESRGATVALCFGNLPPLFRLGCPAWVFFQNRNLLRDSDLSGFSPAVRARHWLERLWIRFFRRNARGFLVQTPHIAEALRAEFGKSVRVEVDAFVPKQARAQAAVSSSDQRFGSQKFDFVYVASGDPHKNHSRLLEAWSLLAKEGHYPSLALTVPDVDHSGLVYEVLRRAAADGLKVTNFGSLASSEVSALYEVSRCLIYPSLGESLGLPLVEAREHGLPVVASERDFVRELMDPVESFDPESAVSISRAVKRFLKIDRNFAEMGAPRQFMERLPLRGP